MKFKNCQTFFFAFNSQWLTHQVYYKTLLNIIRVTHIKLKYTVRLTDDITGAQQ